MQGLERLKRKVVGKIGERIFRGTDELFERASRIETDALPDRDTFAWTARLERDWLDIQREADELLAHRSLLPTFQEISRDQTRISPDDRWRVFFLYGFGMRSELGCALCPETAAVLDRIPDLETAFFSVLAPGKHVPRHRGVSRAYVRCHLGLRVPAAAEQCRMEVDGREVHWREGETVLFDDTRPHEVWNDTDEERVVLLIDVRRPMSPRARALLGGMRAVFLRSRYIREAIGNQRRWEATRGRSLARAVRHPRQGGGPTPILG
ncbi:MAG: aspartyl/asparaginyl beta-hydroxylase domain-containing protein [Deltaproteobacteria bacterium]|nr:aspartyl/asparaginyl beta-hydroxylase domain-containing protein [Deltaproteobacteria bacterium]